mmetsp:Transcript_38676/g.62877  ORF Transcript_38676/g.62877 Transcript_38676/m.62877 type:complete len:95 (+) Transcript_38676:2-286(+)
MGKRNKGHKARKKKKSQVGTQDNLPNRPRSEQELKLNIRRAEASMTASLLPYAKDGSTKAMVKISLGHRHTSNERICFVCVGFSCPSISQRKGS